MDKLLPHLHVGFPMDQSEGPSTSWQRSVLLVSAITLHNIPEGLAVGVAATVASSAAILPYALAFGTRGPGDGFADGRILNHDGT
jgi:ZIP family zinc transporter